MKNFIKKLFSSKNTVSSLVSVGAIFTPNSTQNYMLYLNSIENSKCTTLKKVA